MTVRVWFRHQMMDIADADLPAARSWGAIPIASSGEPPADPADMIVPACPTRPWCDGCGALLFWVGRHWRDAGGNIVELGQ